VKAFKPYISDDAFEYAIYMDSALESQTKMLKFPIKTPINSTVNIVIDQRRLFWGYVLSVATSTFLITIIK
jgi:hypothetical protein